MSVSTRDHAAVANRPRRRLQFSLRMLFVVVTLFALWLGDYVDPVRKLQRRLRDESQQVRLAAVHDLGRLSLEMASARAAIPAAFEDRSPLVRGMAAWEFSRSGGDWQKITPLLNDAEADVRLAAAEAILWCGGDPVSVMPAVMRLAAETAQSGSHSYSDADAVIAAFGPETSSAVLPKLLNSLASDDAVVQSGAREVLRSLPRPSASAVSDLIRLLDHRVPEVRLVAAEQLMRLGQEAAPAAPALEKRMSDSDPPVAAAATVAWCVASDRDVELPAILFDYLSSDDPEQQRRAGLYFKRLGPRASAAASALVGLPGNDYDRPHSLAAESLDAIGPAAIGALSTAIAGSPNAGVRLRAVLALERLGPRARDAAPALIAALEDADEWVRLSAASALIAMDVEKPRAIAELRRLLKANDESVVFGAFAAFDKIDAIDLGTRYQLHEMVQEGTERERITAAGALIRCGDRRKAILTLLVAMIDGDSRNACDAMRLIGQIGPSAAPAVDRLAGLLAADRAVSAGIAGWSVCFDVSDALSGIGAPAVPKLCEALRHPDPRARALAARALGQIGPDAKSAVPLLVQRLGDFGEFHSVSGCIGSTTVVRDEAIDALGKIGPDAREAVDRLGSMLASASADGLPDYKKVRIIRALGGIGADARSALPSILRPSAVAQEELVLPAAMALAKIDPDHPQTLQKLCGVWREIERFRSTEVEEAAEAVWRLGPRAASLATDLHRMVFTAPVLAVPRRSYAAYALAAFEAERPAALAYLREVGVSDDHVDSSIASDLLGELKRRHEVGVE
ncbi:MAG TPA: HEAT repeat domain-containing protein [Pirellulales bacterium]|nr:HEAT repeat domain-containing protein [Pirellulales bacterium]